MFGKAVTLFELFGFKVKIDFTWLFLALLITWSLAVAYFPITLEGYATETYWWMGIAGMIGLFISLVFHEMSHSLVARVYGLEISGITLFVFGGVAEMTEEPSSPSAEFFMAIAGPLASLLLSGIFLLLATLISTLTLAAPAEAVLRYLALLNLVLAVFNMLPGFPLDGGRVLRAFLWWRWNDLRRATRMAAQIGGGAGWVLIGLGILSAFTGNLIMGIWWFLLGLFLRGAAANAYFQVQTRQTLAGESVRRFMVHDLITVPGNLSVAEFVEDYVYVHLHDMFPVVQDSRLIGSVSLRQVQGVPRENWAGTRLRDIAEPAGHNNTVDVETDAMDALKKMRQNGASRLLVTSDGALVGILTLKDLMRFLSIKLDFEERF